MPLYEYEGKRPQVDPTAFLAPNATLIGDVRVAAGASIWYGAVLRADVTPILIGENANVQDNAVLHGPQDAPIEIGAGATIAHSVVFHGASLGAGSIVGNNSTVLDLARIGAGSMLAAHSVLSPHTEIPDGVLAAGSPAVVKRPIQGTAAEEWLRISTDFYIDLARRHRDGITEVPR
ncbi:gamma carbonic anhydrase family protein [Nocardia shimofusensis]|uniref:gamma carbonic anhydrase family protein n=1 Tax=Nocardia shimofusensis TaxID=228596 RepID=UPI0008358ABC|nr:gamma carbonic anhydrase family protein [Nocardia shimofusensis]